MDTSSTPLQTAPSKKKNPTLIIGIIAGFIIIGIGMVWSTRQRSPAKTYTYPAGVVPSAGPSLTPTLIPHPVSGSMTIKTKDNGTRYQVGKPVNLVIEASSEGKNIVGYDAILSYDSKGFAYQGATSLSSDFQLYPHDRKTYISFSGIRSLQSTATNSWSSYPLIEVVLVPKEEGRYTFELSPQGPEASKLVDDKAQAVYPKTQELHLEIYR